MSRKKLATNLFELMPLMGRKFFRKIKDGEYPKMHHRLLHTIYHHDNEPMRFYGEKMFISKPNLTKLVDQLVADEYIVRVNDEKDRRVIRLKITDLGHEMVEKHHKELIEQVAIMFEVFSDEEIDSLNYHFEEIYKLVDKVE